MRCRRCEQIHYSIDVNEGGVFCAPLAMVLKRLDDGLARFFSPRMAAPH